VTHAQVVRRVIKPAVFVACLGPLAWLIYSAVWGDLGANPVETITNTTGIWTLRFLVITVAITPVRWVTKWNPIINFRRMIGLYAFFYGCLHLLTYVWFDKVFVVAEIVADTFKRPFIFVGMFAFTMLLALAITSTTGWQRRLKKNWQRLHRVVYVAAIAGVVHFAWGQKSDISEPIQWGAFLVVLFGVRIYYAARKRKAQLVPAVSR